jgi:hypothetical protein
MLRPRWLVALAMVVMSGLQAWDSNILTAEGHVQAMVGIAILLPAIAVLATADVGARAAAVAVGAVLVIVARMVSSAHLPELFLAMFFPAMVVIIDQITAKRANEAQGS